MAYRVVLADSAKADANAIYERVAAEAPHRGRLWFEDLVGCLYSLDHIPMRCPLARESAKTGREIRCLHFGKGRSVYRILYEVDEPRHTVWVLHGRHGARKDMATGEIASPAMEQ